MSDCGTGSTNTRMGDAAPAVPDGSLTARSTCSGSKADAELLMGAGTRRGARAARPKKAKAQKVLQGGKTNATSAIRIAQRKPGHRIFGRGSCRGPSLQGMQSESLLFCEWLWCTHTLSVRPVPHFQLRTSIFLTASFRSTPLSF